MNAIKLYFMFAAVNFIQTYFIFEKRKRATVISLIFLIRH